MKSISLLPALLASIAYAKTDLSGCTSTDVSSPAGASIAWIVPGTGELCDFLDCGGGRAPARTDVPGCPLYSGTATYSPSYLAGYGSATAATAATAASSTSWTDSSATSPWPASDSALSSWDSYTAGTTAWPTASLSTDLSSSLGSTTDNWPNQTTAVETTSRSLSMNGTLTSATLRSSSSTRSSTSSSTSTGGAMGPAQAWFSGIIVNRYFSISNGMRKSLSARRVPRKIGHDEDEESVPAVEGPDSATKSAVERPFSKSRNKPKSVRTSLGPSAVDENEESSTPVLTPKRTNLSRVATERNASKRSSLLASQLPLRSPNEEDTRPSYSATSLQELRDSTPSTPQILQSDETSDLDDVSTGTRELTIATNKSSELGFLDRRSASAIPSAAEIAEKKARRARLAKEQRADEFISLDPEGPDFSGDDNVIKDEDGRLILKPKDKYGLSETRLVRDDEDIMENFDEFTEDGKISLGQKAEAEAAQRRRTDMAAQIAAAEGDSDSGSDASDRERNAAFEAAQTRHGAYARNDEVADEYMNARPRTPPIITPLPSLDGVIERLQKQLADMRDARTRSMQEAEALQREKVRLAEEELRIQRSLKETADKFEALRKEKGISRTGPGIEAVSPARVTEMKTIEPQRGEPPNHDTEEEDSEDAGEDSFAGLGLGASRRGLGATNGSDEAAVKQSDIGEAG